MKIKKRNSLRWIHLLGAAAIGTYIYSPWATIPWFSLVIQVIIIPGLTITGFWMWKPKWFQKTNKSMMLLFFGLCLLVPISESHAQKKLVGGSGGFMVGFKAYNTSAYQYFVAEGGPEIGNNLLQIGGEGYGLINRWVIGGGGYYSGGDKEADGNEEYEIHGGGGYFNVGYVVFNTDQWLIFPLLGFGVDALGINRGLEEDVEFEPDRFLEANYFSVSPMLDFGAGVDWFPGKKGFKLGIRTGYNISLSRDNEWRHYGGKLTNEDVPDNNLDGFYIRLTLGGGQFVSK